MKIQRDTVHAVPICFLCICECVDVCVKKGGGGWGERMGAGRLHSPNGQNTNHLDSPDPQHMPRIKQVDQASQLREQQDQAHHIQSDSLP